MRKRLTSFLPRQPAIDEGASSTLARVELGSIIKNDQLDNLEGLSSWEQVYSLAA